MWISLQKTQKWVHITNLYSVHDLGAPPSDITRDTGKIKSWGKMSCHRSARRNWKSDGGEWVTSMKHKGPLCVNVTDTGQHSWPKLKAFNLKSCCVEGAGPSPAPGEQAAPRIPRASRGDKEPVKRPLSNTSPAAAHTSYLWQFPPSPRWGNCEFCLHWGGGGQGLGWWL